MPASSSIHFRILEDIARDLSGDVNFPTCMDAAILVRNTLKDPFAEIHAVLQVIGVEPLISSKLLRLANSVSYNRSGKSISDLATAIQLLGFDVVRTTSLAVAMDQMLKSRHLAAFDDVARSAWEHSVRVASISRVLARRLGGINPDQAMLAGLVHEIGIFYLLYRVAEYPEYRGDHAALYELLAGWHESVGESLLHLLGLPEEITEAVRTHAQLESMETPCSIRDVLYLANLLAGDGGYGQPPAFSEADLARRETERQQYSDLLEEADEDIRELHAALGN